MIKKLLLVPLLAVLCLAPAWQPAHAASKSTVTNVRQVTRNDADVPFVRTVLDVTTMVKPRVILDTSGKYITVTLPNTTTDENLPKKYKANTKVITQLAVEKHAFDTDVNIRVPQALNKNEVKVFTLASDRFHNRSNRVVIDIPDKSGTIKQWNHWKEQEDDRNAGAIPSTVAPQPTKIKFPIATPAAPSYSVTQGLKDKVICIDPGHGGSDSGAIGKVSMEKNITLTLSKKVQKLLEQAGAKVVMTRTTDVDVYAPNDGAVEELQARCDIANNAKADVFVCIHIDSFSTGEATGVTSYYNSKTPYDFALAKYLHLQNMKATSFDDRGIKTANFYVLLHTNMPATLLELGFISNYNEEMALNTEEQQDGFANSIVQGLADYFNAGGK